MLSHQRNNDRKMPVDWTCLIEFIKYGDLKIKKSRSGDYISLTGFM